MKEILHTSTTFWLRTACPRVTNLEPMSGFEVNMISISFAEVCPWWQTITVTIQEVTRAFFFAPLKHIGWNKICLKEMRKWRKTKHILF